MGARLCIILLGIQLTCYSVLARTGHDVVDDFLSPRDPYVLGLLGIYSTSFAHFHEELLSCTQQDPRTNCRVYQEWLNPAFHTSLQQYFWDRETQLLIFGERHVDQGHQRTLAGLIPRLKHDGFEVLALEMFNAQDQHVLDQYLADEISLDQVLTVMAQSWSYPLSGYAELLESAKSQGLHIVGLDDRDRDRSLEDFSADLIFRDQQMASELRKYNGKKVIFYTGRLHAVKSFNVAPAEGVRAIAEQLNGDFTQVETYLFYSESSRGLFWNLRRMSQAPDFTNIFTSDVLSNYVDGLVMVNE